MKKIKGFFCLVLVLVLVACSDAKIEGDVYIVKGDGSVKPVAARDVLIMPFDTSFERFLYTNYLDSKEVTYAAFTGELLESCNALSEEFTVATEDKTKPNVVKYFKPLADDFIASKCGKIKAKINGAKEALLKNQKRNVNELAKLLKDKKASTEKLTNLRKERQENVTKKANSLKDAEGRKIRVTSIPNKAKNEYDVTITNNSKYCINGNTVFWKSGQMAMDIYSKNQKVANTGIHSPRKEARDEFGFRTGCTIAPGKSVTFNLDILIRVVLRVSSFDSEKMLLIKEHNLPTIGDTFGSTRYIVATEFKPIYELYYPAKGVRKGNTITYSPKKVMFDSIASKKFKYKEDAEITLIKAKIDKLVKGIAKFNRGSNTDSIGELNKELFVCKADEYFKYHQKVISNCAAKSFSSADASTILESLAIAKEITRSKVNLPDFSQKLSDVFSDKVISELEEKKHHTAVTDINGRFKVDKLKKGQYLFLSNYSDDFNKGFFKRLQKIEADTTVDLNMKNITSGTFDAYLTKVALRACPESETCTYAEFESSIP